MRNLLIGIILLFAINVQAQETEMLVGGSFIAVGFLVTASSFVKGNADSHKSMVSQRKIATGLGIIGTGIFVWGVTKKLRLESNGNNIKFVYQF